MTDKAAMSNIELNNDKSHALVSVNPQIYDKEIIYSAAYAMIDRAYIVIDGDPEKKVLVEIRPKDSSNDAGQLALEFNEELINYAVYKSQARQNKDLRKAIINLAFTANSVSDICSNDNETYIDDPEGIAKPWVPQEK